MALDIKGCLKKTGPLYQALRSARIYLNRRNELYEIPIAICTNPMGFSFGYQGWNYLVEQLKEFDKKKDIAVKDSILAAFHRLYQPKDMSELPILAGYSVTFKPCLFIYPWGSFHIEKSQIGGVIKNACNSRFYGPSSLELVDRDFSNLKKLYISIKKHGYNPWYFKNDFIFGVFLEKIDGRKQFVVLQGNHRLAILAHLGYQQVLVRRVADYYEYLREDELSEWFYVKSGECSKEDARAYFDAFFKLNGSERAKRIGLYLPCPKN